MSNDKRQLVYLSDAAIPSREANSIQTMKMCEAFAAHGLEVTLLIPNRPTEESGNPYAFYDVEQCFEIVTVPWKPGERYLYSLLTPYYVRKIDPNIVYGRFVPACFFTSLTGYRVVVEAHTPVTEEQPIIAWMFKVLIRLGRLKQLVVISEALCEHYLTTYNDISLEDITIAHDAASERPDVEPLPFVDSARLQVGYVGHLYEGKGMSLIADLIVECPWADFHIVGGTDEDIEYWKTVLEGVENVEFHGFVPPRDVARYQLSMDVLLAPYQREVYGSSGGTDISQWMSPLKIFEYMSAGKIIVASDLAILREVLIDGETALLCSPNDVAAWKRALELISNDPNQRQRIEENAKAAFERNHSYRKRAESIIQDWIATEQE